MTDARLGQALEASVQMRAAAERGDWAVVSTLQSACDEQVRQASLNLSDAPVLRQIHQHQQAVLALASSQRVDLAQALSRHHANHRAVSAYIASSDPA